MANDPIDETQAARAKLLLNEAARETELRKRVKEDLRLYDRIITYCYFGVVMALGVWKPFGSSPEQYELPTMILAGVGLLGYLERALKNVHKRIDALVELLEAEKMLQG